MTISITNYDELINFIKRNDISAVDSLNVFCEAVNVTCITFFDAVTQEPLLKKANVIQEAEKFIKDRRENRPEKKIIIFFS